MYDDILRGYDREMKDAIEVRQEKVANGQCANFEEYKQICGELRGLAMARDTLKALLDKLKEANGN